MSHKFFIIKIFSYTEKERKEKEEGKEERKASTIDVWIR
jgi:hypothetical protein